MVFVLSEPNDCRNWLGEFGDEYECLEARDLGVRWRVLETRDEHGGDEPSMVADWRRCLRRTNETTSLEIFFILTFFN
jgi:hypothetical protein